MRERLPSGVDTPRPIQWVDRAHLGWVLLGLFVAGVFLFVFYSYVGTFVFAVFIYYATRPVYRRVERYVRPPSLAAAVSLFLLALPVMLLMGSTLLIAISEVESFLSQNQFNTVAGATKADIIATSYIDLLSSPRQLIQALPGIMDTITDTGALTAVQMIGNGLMHALIMVGIAFYLLRDDQQFSRWARDRFGDEEGLLEEFMDAVDHDFHQVFFGNILNAVITGLIAAVTYNAVNFIAPAGLSVPYPTLLGLISGAASLIPLVGMKLVYVPMAVYILGVSLTSGMTDALWFPATFAAVAFFVVDVIPDMVLRPYVSARDLHMGTVMFAYLLGPLLFGWYGIFLGPMLLVIAVRFNRIVLPELLERVFGSSSRREHPAPPVLTINETPTEEADDVPGSDPTAGDD
ncbi:MAG: AI-2E family transporter [Halobacteriales archaeon]